MKGQTAAHTLLFLAVVLGSAVAQEYRGTILGIVTDPTGAAVPGAAVTVTNNATSVTLRTQTNERGLYQLPYLLPGFYTLEVSAPGFKTYRRGPIEVQVADRTRIDVTLEIGAATQQVTVTAEVPLVEEATATRGQVVTRDQIASTPLDGHNPFTLMNLAAGVNYTGSLLYSRPFDNGAIADFSINGGVSGINDYQIDGAPNNANTGRSNLAYVPPKEATQEFKIVTNIYDAQLGRTGGGVISVSVKSGTNDLHAAAYEYLRRTALNANQFSANALGQPRVERRIDQYGLAVDGPVRLPRLYNGRDRSFFMFAAEKYWEVTPQPRLITVPTPEERAGDFSKTFTSTGALYTIHDDLTYHANPDFDRSKPVSVNNPRYLRDPFPGNRIPESRMDSIALRVLQYVPLPNREGHPLTHAENWYAARAREETPFYNLIARIDHVINQSWRMYGRWSHNVRDGGRIDYYDWGTPATYQGRGFRRNDGAVVDFVGTLTPRTILSTRVSFNRFDQNFTRSIYPFDVGSLGFPTKFVGQLQNPRGFPYFTFENYASLSRSGAQRYASDTYCLQVGLNTTRGRHLIKYGFELRLLHFARFDTTYASGRFAFTRAVTSRTSDVTDPNSGNAIASFLLGYLSSASARINDTPYVSWRYPVFYVQEDWRVTDRLTLNVGFRWDYESPPVERYNRQTRGFDFVSPSPIKVSGLELRGGLVFAGVDGQPRGAYRRDWDNFQPRFGLAYRLAQTRPLVFRAGFGRSFLPTTETGGNEGFTQETNAETTSVEGRNIRLLSNPFPNGLTAPPGASLGLATKVGDAISFNHVDRTIPWVWQYSAGFQYEIFPRVLIEASYVGSQTRALQTSRNINVLTKEQLALGTVYLNEGFPNPFYGVLPITTARGSVQSVQRRVLMLPYPHFSTITMNMDSRGASWYNSLQLKLEKRFRHGFSALVTYTNAKTMDQTQYLNAQDEAPSRELASYDVPQRLVISGIWRLPFGRRQPLLKKGWPARLAGGWQLSLTGNLQAGPPISLPDWDLLGDPRLPKSEQSLLRWFNTSRQIWVQRAADTLRTTKLRSPNIRRHSAPQFNLSLTRSFRISERHKLELRGSAFNLANTPIFGQPNTSPASPLFGTVPITQINLPRAIELGLRYSM